MDERFQPKNVYFEDQNIVANDYILNMYEGYGAQKIGIKSSLCEMFL